MSRLTDEIYEWDTRRVVEWLREQGLNDCERIFYQQRINGRALLNFQDYDITSLRVSDESKSKLQKCLQKYKHKRNRLMREGRRQFSSNNNADSSDEDHYQDAGFDTDEFTDSEDEGGEYIEPEADQETRSDQSNGTSTAVPTGLVGRRLQQLRDSMKARGERPYVEETPSHNGQLSHAQEYDDDDDNIYDLPPDETYVEDEMYEVPSDSSGGAVVIRPQPMSHDKLIRCDSEDDSGEYLDMRNIAAFRAMKCRVVSWANPSYYTTARVSLESSDVYDCPDELESGEGGGPGFIAARIEDDQAQYEIGAHEPVQDMYMVPHDEGVSEDMYEMPDTTDQATPPQVPLPQIPVFSQETYEEPTNEEATPPQRSQPQRARPQRAPPQKAPRQRAPPQGAPPQRAPPQGAPPQRVSPHGAPPQRAPPRTPECTQEVYDIPDEQLTRDTPPQRAPPPAPVETEETYEVPDDKSAAPSQRSPPQRFGPRGPTSQGPGGRGAPHGIPPQGLGPSGTAFQGFPPRGPGPRGMPPHGSGPKWGPGPGGMPPLGLRPRDMPQQGPGPGGMPGPRGMPSQGSGPKGMVPHGHGLRGTRPQAPFSQRPAPRAVRPQGPGQAPAKGPTGDPSGPLQEYPPRNIPGRPRSTSQNLQPEESSPPPPRSPSPNLTPRPGMRGAPRGPTPTPGGGPGPTPGRGAFSSPGPRRGLPGQNEVPPSRAAVPPGRGEFSPGRGTGTPGRGFPSPQTRGPPPPTKPGTKPRPGDDNRPIPGGVGGRAVPLPAGDIPADTPPCRRPMRARGNTGGPPTRAPADLPPRREPDREPEPLVSRRPGQSSRPVSRASLPPPEDELPPPIPGPKPGQERERRPLSSPTRPAPGPFQAPPPSRQPESKDPRSRRPLPQPSAATPPTQDHRDGRSNRDSTFSGSGDDPPVIPLHILKNSTERAARRRSGMPLPEQPTKKTDEDIMKEAPWFHGDLDRKLTESSLKNCGRDGAFVVRNSTRTKGEFSMSLLCKGKVSHLRIPRKDGKFILGDHGTDQFDSISKLVEFYRTHPVELKSGGATPLTVAAQVFK